VLNQTFVGLAKLDHLLFKVRAYQGFVGKEKSEFSDHHSCRLGRWYEAGTGKENFSHLPSFPTLETPHKAVHDHIIHAVEAITKKTKEGDREAFALLEKAETASRQVMEILDRLVKEEKENRGSRQKGEINFF
jgi:hypothetical protein